VARIAEREGVDADRARHDLAAVLAALARLLPSGLGERLRAEVPAAFEVRAEARVHRGVSPAAPSPAR